jgi:hypothetical protein
MPEGEDGHYSCERRSTLDNRDGNDLYNEAAWAPISWGEVHAGQKVWLRGTHNGVFRAYGPHIVASTPDRTLASGTPATFQARFMHYADDLLVPRSKEGAC